MIKYNPQYHNRRSIRLKGYDYSRAGLYFITICSYGRKCLFGDVIHGEMRLNNAGIVTRSCWLAIPDHFPNVILHQFVIMPNHVHGIIEFTVGAKNFSPLHEPPEPHEPYEPPESREQHKPRGRAKQRASGTSKTVGSVVRGFKIGVTKWMRNNTDIYHIWQRNYYDHIIRNEKSHHIISKYIRNNPANWRDDRFYKN